MQVTCPLHWTKDGSSDACRLWGVDARPIGIGIESFTLRGPSTISMAAGLKTIILLSFVLAVGFLLIILSCALWANWLPLLVALLYVLAPLPNSICAKCAGADDFSADYNSSFLDFGNWLTSVMVVSGFALPVSLAHSGVIHDMACIMAMLGGGLVYGTILTYSGFFNEGSDDYF